MRPPGERESSSSKTIKGIRCTSAKLDRLLTRGMHRSRKLRGTVRLGVRQQPLQQKVNFMSVADLESDAFHQAVTAIDAGDVDGLQLLLAAHPRLVSDRLEGSPEWLRLQLGDAADGFFSHPYLLWFVAEDPVRNGRLPPNVVEIIGVIVAAACKTNVVTLQDQLDSTLRLVCWSGVAADAGL